MVWSILKLFAWRFHEPIVFTCSHRLLFFQNLLISILVMTILSTAGTIHCLQYYLFVYQVLRTFNMLTKSKISEARFQVRRTCNHVEQRSCDTFRVSDTLCLQHAYEIKDFGSTMFRCWKHRNHVECQMHDTFSWFRTDRFVTMLSTAGAIHIYSKMPEQEQTIPDTCPPLSPHRRFRIESASTLK